MLFNDSLALPVPVALPQKYAADVAEQIGDQNLRLLDDACFGVVVLEHKGDPRNARLHPGQTCRDVIAESVGVQSQTHSRLAEMAAHERLLDASAVLSRMNQIREAARTAYREAHRLFQQNASERDFRRIEGKLQRIPVSA